MLYDLKRLHLLLTDSNASEVFATVSSGSLILILDDMVK